MRNVATLVLLCFAGSISWAGQAGVPPWARTPAAEVARNGVLRVGPGARGDAPVTHQKAAIALAKLARVLLAGTWRSSPRAPLRQSALNPPGDWKNHTVTQYAFAAVLARVGDDVANGLPRPPKGAKDLAKSIAIPRLGRLAVPRSNPAYGSLAWMANYRMVWPGSPLLKADRKPITAAELARAVAEMVDGLTDRVTPLGLNSKGETPDTSFHHKPAVKP